MNRQAVLLLRLSYWAGAILDLGAGMMMVYPGLFVPIYCPPVFRPGLDYRFAMGMGAPLMFAWTVVLLWADRKPMERKGILPITMLVVAGEAATQVWGVVSGFIPLQPVLLTFSMQLLLSALFLFSYLNAGEAKWIH